jgi:hypothetical protein
MSCLSFVVALSWPTNFTVSLSFQYLDKYQRRRGVIGTGLAPDVPDDMKRNGTRNPSAFVKYDLYMPLEFKPQLEPQSITLLRVQAGFMKSSMTDIARF